MDMFKATEKHKVKLLVKAVKSKPNELRHFKVDPVCENLMRLFISRLDLCDIPSCTSICVGPHMNPTHSSAALVIVNWWKSKVGLQKLAQLGYSTVYQWGVPVRLYDISKFQKLASNKI